MSETELDVYQGDAPKVQARGLDRIAVLQGAFVLSGFCGLIYESIWSHYLKLFVGHAAYAQTVVLIVFIGGMALGAWLIGRRGESIRKPLVAYAAAEAAIGVISLLFHRIFIASTDWAYASLLPLACVPESPCFAQWAFASLLILPQSILLGTTFPLMTSGILRIAGNRHGERIALFYFLNSIGAVIGVLAAGFVLIPAVGLPGALLTAGLLNLTVALIAYACAKGAETRPVVRAAATDVSADRGRFVMAMLLIAGLTGLSSFVYEIVWIRMLSLVIGASTHAFELMLAAFILGLALGGAWVRKRIDGYGDLVKVLAVVQILMGAAAVATFPVYDATFDFLAWLLRTLNRSESGYVVYNAASHLIALAVMLPATFLAGMTLPLITAELLKGERGERAIGFVYAANTLGAIVGVIVAVHLAMPLLGVKGGLILGAAIDVALGIALFSMRKAPTRKMGAASLGWSAAGVAAIVVVAAAVNIEPTRMSSGVYRYGVTDVSGNVLYHTDGKTATITMVDRQGSRSIRTNGKPDAALNPIVASPSTDEYTMTLTGLLPLVHKPDAQHVAVIGFGSGMSTATLLASPNVEQVDTIEIEPKIVEGARHFGPLVARAYEDPRSRIVIDDAKSYFARSARKYDLIVSEPSNPWVSGVASLFTREFYGRVKQQLMPGGIFVQWLQIYEFNDRLMASIFAALDAEFNDYAVYAANDGDMVILASADKLPAASDAFTRWRDMQQTLSRYGLASAQEIQARRIAGRDSIKTLLGPLRAPENSDYFPVVDQDAPKARYLRSAADGLMRLSVSNVPIVEILERQEPASFMDVPQADESLGRRRMSIGIAKNLARYIVTGTVAREDVRLPQDAGLLRAIIFECASIPPRVNLAVLMSDVADYVNAFLPPSEASKVWSAVRGARCSSRLNANDTRWLELFEANAARALDPMAALGSDLVKDSSATLRLRTYALASATAAFLAQGDHDSARRLINQHLPTLPEIRNDPGIRLLVNRAMEAPRSPAVARAS